MTTTELLDKAAASANGGRHVAVVASTPSQREVFRKMLARRLDPVSFGNVTLLAPGASTTGRVFETLFVEPDFWAIAPADAVHWLDTAVKTRLAPNGSTEPAT